MQRTTGGMPTNTTRIADQLRRDIISRRIKAGDRILVADLAGKFQVSGAPVREALQQLAAEGYIAIQPNRGAVARVFGKAELWQLFSVREALTSYQARTFCAVVTDADIAALERLAKAFADEVGGGINRKTARINEEFHEIINGHDDNAELMTILNRHAGVARMMRHDFGQTDGRLAQAAAEHFDLIEALRARDPDRAAAVTATHVRGTLDDIIACFESSTQTKRA